MPPSVLKYKGSHPLPPDFSPLVRSCDDPLSPLRFRALKLKKKNILIEKKKAAHRADKHLEPLFLMLLEFVNFQQLTKNEKQMSARLFLQASAGAAPINKSNSFTNLKKKQKKRRQQAAEIDIESGKPSYQRAPSRAAFRRFPSQRITGAAAAAEARAERMTLILCSKCKPTVSQE